MSKKESVQWQVEKTLSCLDQFQPVKASPDFYKNLVLRINRESVQGRRSGFRLPAPAILKPVFLLIIILFNVFTVLQVLNAGDPVNTTRENHLRSLYYEYNFSPTVTYTVSKEDQG